MLVSGRVCVSEVIEHPFIIPWEYDDCCRGIHISTPAPPSDNFSPTPKNRHLKDLFMGPSNGRVNWNLFFFSAGVYIGPQNDAVVTCGAIWGFPTIMGTEKSWTNHWGCVQMMLWSWSPPHIRRLVGWLVGWLGKRFRDRRWEVSPMKMGRFLRVRCHRWKPRKNSQLPRK